MNNLLNALAALSDDAGTATNSSKVLGALSDTRTATTASKVLGTLANSRTATNASKALAALAVAQRHIRRKLRAE